jgi:hypothetical protein
MLTDQECIKYYNSYLNFFNTKFLTGIKSHLSLQCTVILPDRTVQTYDEMLATYSTHWERAPSPIELREIKAIKGPGVWTLLRDWDGKMDIEVEYFYNDEGLMIQHDIKAVTPFLEEASDSVGRKE